MADANLQSKAVNTIRFLAADGVQKANSGHPGLPMSLAPIAFVLWTRHMNFNPSDPKWPNRDRFILSAGHGSMLLYAMLHLTGYDLPLEEIQNFRQLGSRTAGHPEYDEAPGTEMTTGPLGQGFATGVGMAIGLEHQAAMYNRDGFPLLDHYVYAIVSDGDLMEGVASEAASLAGHLKLGRLIYIYDDNRISIDGSTDITFTEDRSARFESYGWHVLEVPDGFDLDAIDAALTKAKQDPRPSIIIARTEIGYGLPTKQNTAAAHGEPPGETELAGAKEKLGWPTEPPFLIPDDVRVHFEEIRDTQVEVYEAWHELKREYSKSHPELAAQFDRTFSGDLPEALGATEFPADEKGMATRVSSGQVLNELASSLPELMGGSADLTGSNKTDIKGEMAFTAEDRSSRYLHFGVREHAMGAILNGLSLYGGLIPYGGTFLVFSDYLRPSIRLAALMKLRVIYVFTHDSIGLGEDGPTHQPIEHLAALRAIPDVTVIRPADANETAYAWLAALRNRAGPTALALTRQALPTYDREVFSSAEGLQQGAYTLGEFGDAPLEIILMASGSEVEILIEAAKMLHKDGIASRVVSFPSWELFELQPEAYQEEVLPRAVKARVAVEAGVSQGWEKWVGELGAIVGIDRFGVSAPYKDAYGHLGLTPDEVVSASKKVLDNVRS